jgi:hypothetical protein
MRYQKKLTEIGKMVGEAAAVIGGATVGTWFT